MSKELEDEIRTSYMKIKRKLTELQRRHVVSTDYMPFEFANGQTMFSRDRTKQLIRGTVLDDAQIAIRSVADTMRDMSDIPDCLTAGLAPNSDREMELIFVYRPTF